MQTVNEVRLAILEAFLEQVDIAVEDEEDPRWRVSDLAELAHDALDAAMP